MLEVAETNPEIKVATRAAKSLGADIEGDASPTKDR
jgi:hypothetical protein